jgi:hypothetical protein
MWYFVFIIQWIVELDRKLSPEPFAYLAIWILSFIKIRKRGEAPQMP